MTYNAHRCIGADGRRSPERIAHVIAAHRPDVVALQELDARYGRSGWVDQADVIARHLQMTFHFEGLVRLAESSYGIAILSRRPMRLMGAGPLPGKRHWPDPEPRGAIWMAVDVGGQSVQVINSHLSFWPRTRLLQASALLSDQWLAHPSCRGPIVLCGDLNAVPGSMVCRQIGRVLRDAQLALTSRRPMCTWNSRYPLARIDHIFISQEVKVANLEVPRTALARSASDHLPLFVDIQWPGMKMKELS